MQVTANEVADYILASAHEAGEPLTNLKLQKLVYYVQAWYLAFYGEPLFDERFEAWVHGPVCPPLYGRFKSYQWSPISEAVKKPQLPEKLRLHLENVIEVYGSFSAWDLERLSHQEAPWLDTRGGLAPDASCSREIPVAAMKEFFEKKGSHSSPNTAFRRGGVFIQARSDYREVHSCR